ncbi:hypothetical protein HHI36_007962 [Cryptolaemus montrouzieri]|uniref:Uncharacterized protein n=1 Tax=Cryptolaemus montrouzieri TaxID=559131 RepID=A0ABD2MR92_9CUCU
MEITYLKRMMENLEETASDKNVIIKLLNEDQNSQSKTGVVRKENTVAAVNKISPKASSQIESQKKVPVLKAKGHNMVDNIKSQILENKKNEYHYWEFWIIKYICKRCM